MKILSRVVLAMIPRLNLRFEQKEYHQAGVKKSLTIYSPPLAIILATSNARECLMNTLGTKVRSIRRREHLTQTDLAAKLEISPSYLNLIEHNQRPLPAHLLVKVAQVLKVDLDSFADDDHSRLAGDLQEAFGDPMFEEHPLTTGDMRELSEHPATARAVLALYQAYRSTVESTRALASKVYDGNDFHGIDPAHLPSEEVSDVIQHNVNFFPELEAAADEIAGKIDRADRYRSLVQHLSEQHRIEVSIVPVSRDRAATRRYDPERRVLSLSEVLPPWSRQFQLAHQLGLIEAADVIDAIVVRSKEFLTTPESAKLCRIALASYFGAALLMPYDDFLRVAEQVRYDIELLQHHYTASWEQVCHRLTTLRHPSRLGVPFHFVRVDIAGNISKRFSGTGIRFARFSGSCPRWDVHAAFLTPVGIGCPVDAARKLVYADGYDLDNLDAAVPIGTTCRLCERLDCEQRAFPPLQHGFTIDENVRGASFYAPAGAPAVPIRKKKR